MRRLLLCCAMCLGGCTPDYDVVVRGGAIYDGSGNAAFTGDIAIVGDSIVAVGEVAGAGRVEIDARGMAVAPGFINILSWATESLLQDGRSMGDIVQGVTLEVFGEGWSMGPLNEGMRAEMLEDQGDIQFDVPWTTLGEYLEHLEARGISPNVASFVGATTIRIHEIGYEDRPPSAAELENMRRLVRDAMEEGALGVGTSLIYAPAFYAATDELVALATVAAQYGGRYISHMRSEGNKLLEALDELITIAREAGIGAEIYHLKAAGRDNWGKLDDVIAAVERARSEGLDVTANMYLYPAGATGLDAAMPPWVQEGGEAAWIERLQDPAIRRRVLAEMTASTDDWENLYYAAGTPENVLLVGFDEDSLRYLTGKSLAEISELRGTQPAETAMDLVIQNGSDVGTVYFLMSEENVEREVALQWMSFGSDAGSMIPEPPFTNSNTHPRAYGNFARLLGRYVRERATVSLAEAVRRLTSFPATNLGIRRRGLLTPGYYADVVVFDPDSVIDRATFAEPHRLSVGVKDVLVNGVAVLRDGQHTGELPGRVVRGPGWTGWETR
ncbi:MAG: amidohydrolase family protein [Gemmatimonadales bacterium]